MFLLLHNVLHLGWPLSILIGVALIALRVARIAAGRGTRVRGGTRNWPPTRRW